MTPAPSPARLYPRGFLLSPDVESCVEEIPSYRTTALPGFVLHVDDLTEVAVAVAGEDWTVVLGKAWPLSSGDLPPEGDTAQHLLRLLRSPDGPQAVEDALYDLAGRYAVLARRAGRVLAWNDAAGTRSVFFNAGQQQVASHYDMLERSARGGERRHPFGRPVGVNLLMDLTSHSDVGALLANHRLELSQGRQVRFHGTAPNRMTGLSVEHRLELVETLWTEQLDRLVALDVPLVLSMSGGLDSRTMLAMARRHKSHFRSFTYTSASAVEGGRPKNRWEEVMAVDYHLSEAMREFLPSRHKVIPRSPSEWTETNRETLDRNSTHVHGRWLLPAYLTITSDPRAVHYRGNLLEVGRYYWGTTAGSGDALTTLSHVLRTHAPKSDLPTDSVDALLRSRGEALGFTSLHEDYPVADMAYWEVRHSRWYSQVLNETDTVFDTTTPVNVRRVLDLLLSFPVEERKTAWCQRELIHRNHPALLFFGVNDRTDLYRQYVSKARQPWPSLR